MPDCKCSGEQLVFMVTILNHGQGERVITIFTDEGVTYNLFSLGHGTAGTSILDYLGLKDTKKDIIFSTMPQIVSKAVIKKLLTQAKLATPGHGIAFTLPINCVVGNNTIKKLKGLSEIDGGDYMEQNNNHDLIIAVANRGFTDEVMESAKLANATGGTVIHARGTGLKEAEKFLGVTIQPEKELILILTKREHRRAIMEAIAANAGPHTNAKAIVFSLPVNDVIGLSCFDCEIE